MVREEKEINEIRDFFCRTPPFNRLNPETVESTVGQVSIHYYPKDFYILRQDGAPCSALHLIRRGEVKVFVREGPEDEILIDHRSDGESFGFVSLLSGDKSRANVVAVQDTVCYVIPKDHLLDLLNDQPHLRDFFMRSFFWNFIDKTFDEMTSRNFPFGEGDKLLFTTPVRQLVSRDVVTMPQSISIREAAQTMSLQGTSSLVLVDNEGVPSGIITDRDLREKVVARSLSYENPVGSIMSPPLIRVDGGEASFEALLRMIRYNVHHLLVIENGKLTGILTNHDFMMLQGTSPLSIVRSIQSQNTMEGLRPTGNRIQRIGAMLIQNGVKARQTMRLISELGDQLMQRVAQLITEELGPPPLPLAVALLGSSGRKEQTLKTSVDCLILAGDPESMDLPASSRAYLDRFVSRFRREIGACAISLFPQLPLGGGTLYDTPGNWDRRFLAGLRRGDIQGAAKLLDLRHLWGVERLTTALEERLRRNLHGDRWVVERLLSAPLSTRFHRGFRRRWVGGWPGEEDGRLNLKEYALRPIVEGVRLLAAERGVKTTQTVERIQRLGAEDGAHKRLMEDLSIVFEFLTQLRLEDQVRKIQADSPPDDLVDISGLTHLQRKNLRETFTVIHRFQEFLRRNDKDAPQTLIGEIA